MANPLTCTLNQRVLGSSPSASTIFQHKINVLDAFSSKVEAIRFRLGSILGSTINYGAFFPFAAAYENRMPQKAPFGIARGQQAPPQFRQGCWPLQRDLVRPPMAEI
jgi:hypothetical protein